jgi:exodeoxyribonuclease-3
MRVITFNANGIRAAASKGFFAWLEAQNADVVCIQETKSQEADRTGEVLAPAGFTPYYVDAKRRGYSGVAIFARREPVAVQRGLGWADVDPEGRYVRADFGAFTVSSLYVPSGTMGASRQAAKESFLERFLSILVELRHDGREHILCGDFNIAHLDIDTFDPASNAYVTGYFPDERRWMDTVVDQVGWVDAFRVRNQEPGQYTWWSNTPQAFPKNRGWRIDYQMITPGLAGRVQGVSIYRGQRFSDHAPLVIDYDLA